MDLVSWSHSANFIDVGYGAPIETSSIYPGSPKPERLIPGRRPGTCFFHTDFEDHPHIIVDLEVVRPIKRMRVFNEEGIPSRATPISIQWSLNKSTWVDIATVNYIFGGRTSSTPVELLFREPILCRYIKITVLAQTFLHLDYIEILTLAPAPELGRLVNLRPAKPFILAEYFHHDSHGFTWTFTYTLALIINARAAGIEVESVDFSWCMIAFKDSQDDDAYRLLFQPPNRRDRLVDVPHVSFQHHGVYATFGLRVLKQYVDVYFTPSERVMAFQNFIISKYQLVPGNTLAIVYRGTDKVTEVNPAPIERYIEAAQTILRARPGLTLVIQTDEEKALQAVVAAIPAALHFDELPVTSGLAPIHGLELEREFALAKSEFGVRMLAVTHLLAQMKYVISHTGNIGLWLALYRGMGDGFYQFDLDTNLRSPSGVVISAVDPAEL